MLATLIDTEMQRLLKDGYTMARALLIGHFDQLTKLADALLEHEQLDRSQFEALFQPEQPIYATSQIVTSAVACSH